MTDSSLFDGMLGLTPWSVKLGYSSFVTLDFGKALVKTLDGKSHTYGVSVSWGNGIWQLTVDPPTGVPWAGIGAGGAFGWTATSTYGTDWFR